MKTLAATIYKAIETRHLTLHLTADRCLTRAMFTSYLATTAAMFSSLPPHLGLQKSQIKK